MLMISPCKRRISSETGFLEETQTSCSSESLRVSLPPTYPNPPVIRILLMQNRYRESDHCIKEDYPPRWDHAECWQYLATYFHPRQFPGMPSIFQEVQLIVYNFLSKALFPGTTDRFYCRVVHRTVQNEWCRVEQSGSITFACVFSILSPLHYLP